jgi:Tol biopolymer transport system component
MKIFRFFTLLVFLIPGLACTQNNSAVDPSASNDAIADSVSATLTAIAPESPTATPEPEGGPVWLTNPDNPTGQILPAFFSGLSYRGDSVWLVDQEGVSHLVMGQPTDGALSPDGTGYLFESSQDDGGDIYYYNIAADTVSQWTDTPDAYEGNFKWWPARPNVIVFNYVPADQLGPWYGYLAAFDIPTSEYIIIDDEVGSGSDFALSPDGEKIAFVQGTQPVIYTWGQGLVELDMESMGLTFTSFSFPTFSPDGSKVAFHASGGESNASDGSNPSATVIVDLQSNSAEVLHEYKSYGQRGGPELVWSPDGRYLAVLNPGEVDAGGEPMALWVFDLDTGEEIFLEFSSSPRWSPDGKYLVFMAWPPIGTSEPHQIIYVETGVWEQIPVEGIEGSFLGSWIDLP